jgi:hypothetical protein
MKRVVLDADVVEPIMDGALNWIYRYISITMMTSGLWIWNDDRLEVRDRVRRRRTGGQCIYSTVY